jgi:hypothetical protein
MVCRPTWAEDDDGFEASEWPKQCTLDEFNSYTQAKIDAGDLVVDQTLFPNGEYDFLLDPRCVTSYHATSPHAVPRHTHAPFKASQIRIW